MKTGQAQQRVIKSALETRKATKREVFGLIQELIDNLTENDNTTIITEYELSRFYSHFLPPLPTRPKTAEQWVAKAVAGKDEVGRPYLQTVYSDGTRLVGTDGHRMHVWENTLWPPQGWYDTQLNQVADYPHPFPNIDRVTPEEKEEHVLYLKDLEVRDFDEGKLHVYLLNDSKKPFAVDRNYLLAALAGEEKFTVLNWPLDDMKAVKLKGPFEDTYSVIMPVRV